MPVNSRTTRRATGIDKLQVNVNVAPASMRRICVFALAACIAMTARARDPSNAPDITAAQIIEKNAAARGGVDAWSKIQTMAWAGHVESPEIPGRNMPF